jgi:hypothetical protein
MEATMLAPLTEIKTRRVRRNRVLLLTEHYKRELGVPDVAVFTSRAKWLTFRGILWTQYDLDALNGRRGEAVSLDHRRTLVPGIWVNIDHPETPAGLEDVVIHEMLHAVYGIPEGYTFTKLQAITWMHARSGRNLARLARAAQRMARAESEWSEAELAEFDRRFEEVLEPRMDKYVVPVSAHG